MRFVPRHAQGAARIPHRAGATATPTAATTDRSNGYGGNGGYSSAERRPRQMFEAPCANCGKIAQLPFQPTGARPVYCSDCFQSQRA